MKIRELKEELKKIAVQIRKLKKEVKAYQKEHGGCHPFKQHVELKAMQRNFRYSHIAYCLLRGRTIEQIEKPKEGNEINMTYVNQVIEKYKEPAVIIEVTK